jgi:hypothetical protein
MNSETEAKWAARVEAWRASGESARAFAARHEFSAATLYARARELSRGASPRFVELVPKAETTPASEIVVEVGAARVRVGAGFDRAVLAEVLRALSDGAR